MNLRTVRVISSVNFRHCLLVFILLSYLFCASRHLYWWYPLMSQFLRISRLNIPVTTTISSSTQIGVHTSNIIALLLVYWQDRHISTHLQRFGTERTRFRCAAGAACAISMPSRGVRSMFRKPKAFGFSGFCFPRSLRKRVCDGREK